MLPCTSTEMDGVLMTASTPWWRKFDQDPKIRWPQPKAWSDDPFVEGSEKRGWMSEKAANWIKSCV
jgi:hypothetical protein